MSWFWKGKFHALYNVNHLSLWDGTAFTLLRMGLKGETAFHVWSFFQISIPICLAEEHSPSADHPLERRFVCANKSFQVWTSRQSHAGGKTGEQILTFPWNFKALFSIENLWDSNQSHCICAASEFYFWDVTLPSTIISLAKGIPSRKWVTVHSSETSKPPKQPSKT